MDDDDYLVSIPDIQKALGGCSRAFVYASVLPALELVKIGTTTNATSLVWLPTSQSTPMRTLDQVGR